VNHPIPSPIPTAEVRPVEGGPGLDLTAFASRIDPATNAQIPAPHPPSESLASLADRLWMAETTALLITVRTIEDVEWADEAEGRSFDPNMVVERLEPENREFFASYLRMFGGTAINWHDWLDLCWTGSPVNFVKSSNPPVAPAYTAEDLEYLTLADIEAEDEVEAENRRQWEGRMESRRRWLARQAEAEAIAEVFDARDVEAVEAIEDIVTISPEGQAEYLGYTLGVQGRRAAALPESSEAEREAFARGNAAGCEVHDAECWAELREDPEYQAWSAERDRERLEAMVNDPRYGPAEWHHAEIVEGSSYSGHPAN
jgi:hypothetical protein